jgi:hypothetical protein
VNAVQALGVFVGIPVALGIIIYVLVSASAWTRSGRASADYDSNPLLIASAPAMPDPSRLPSELSQSRVGGGVSGGW